jgi:hypothetical protein
VKTVKERVNIFREEEVTIIVGGQAVDSLLEAQVQLFDADKAAAASSGFNAVALIQGERVLRT